MLLSVSVLADSPEGVDSPAFTSPSEMHQIMGRQKALALQQARGLRQAAVASPLSASTNYDVLSYDITIRVNDTTEILYGKVGFVAKPTAGGVSSIEVDFHRDMTIDSIVSGPGSLSYSRLVDVVTITLDRAYDPEEQFEFEFWYHGHPTEGGLQAFAFDTHNGKSAISSLSEPYFARTWWPCKDRMDDKADSYRAQIEVDTGLYCASNGTLDSIVPTAANRRTFWYSMDYPMATYLFSVAIAPYVVWQQQYVTANLQDTMPVIHHVYSDWNTYSKTSGWSQTPTMLTVFAEVFGEYPYLDHKYGHANFEWGGGMEHQTCTSMGASTFGFSADVTAHELSHQWWGDLITCESWHDIWLNEGWASYAEAVYHLDQYGWSNYRSYMNGMVYKGVGTVWCDDTTDVWRIFDGSLSYDKGAWVVHMLRGVLGETKFQQGIDAYYSSEFKYGAATTADFKDVWEAATGEDLDWFIDEWIYGQYYPKFQYSVMEEASASGGNDLYIVINQTQTTSPRVFHMPVDLYIARNGAPSDTAVLRLYDRRSRFKVHSTGTTSSVSLDPAGWVLKDATSASWSSYIITVREDISDGTTGQSYVDTVAYRGGSGSNTVTILAGTLPPGLVLSSTGIISGTPTDTGLYSFTANLYNSGTGLTDYETYDIHVGAPATCCVGEYRGNIDGSPDEAVTMGDLTVLIDHLFISYAPLACIDEANVDMSADNEVTMGDMTVLIDHLFVSYQALPPCF